MLFFILPLTLALIALIIIAVIVARKMPFLRKLTPESHEVGDTWLHDMAPEAVDWFREIPWRESLQTLLIEIEKFLRRIRLMFSVIDRASERLVRKVRSTYQKNVGKVQEKQEQLQIIQDTQDKEDTEEVDMGDPEQLKQEEQRLIVAIAQTPKEPELYSDLARVYMRMRNFADAAEALTAAVKLAPENKDYQKRLVSAKNRLMAQIPRV